MHKTTMHSLHTYIRLFVLTLFLLGASRAQSQELPGRAVTYNSIPLPVDSLSVQSTITEANSLRSNNPSQATSLYLKAYAGAKYIYDIDAMGTCMQEVAAIYSSKGMYGKILVLFKDALSYCSWQPGQTEQLTPLIYNGLANVYKTQGEYELAAKYYFQSIGLAEKLSDPGTGALYNNMGAVLYAVEQDDKALQYFNKAEQIALTSRSYETLAYALMNKGLTYAAKAKWAQSEHYYRAALKLAKIHKLTQVRFLTLANMGQMYVDQKKPQRALAYLLKTENIKEDINPGYRQAAHYAIGDAYNQTHNYALAESYLKQSLNNAQLAKNETNIMASLEVLAKITENKGDFKQALQHYKTFMRLFDSTNRKKATEKVNELEIKYRTASMDKQIMANELSLKQKESNLREKNLWIGGISAGAIILAMSIVWLYRYNRQQNKIQAKHIYILHQEQEIAKLKALMEGEEKERIRIAQELHDGLVVQFSAAKMGVQSLSNYHENLSNSPHFGDAVHQLDNAIKDLRKTAHNLLPDVLLEEGLIDAVYYFCNNLRQNTPITINFLSYGTMPALFKDFELQVYRIIQELLHNILKHAQATSALVQINYLDELLSVTVKDNGIGLDETSMKNKKGSGLRNLKTRVEFLKGRMELNGTPGKGTVFYLEFDVKHHRNHNM